MSERNKAFFESCAHEAFYFLSTAFDFRCMASGQTLVRYQSPAVFFEVGHSVSYDHEVYARIGRIGVPGILPDQAPERLDFGLFLAVADPPAYLALRHDVPYACASTDYHIRRVLSYFSSGLRQHGAQLLAADTDAYSRAHELCFWHAPQLPPEAARTQSTETAIADGQTEFQFDQDAS
jgi:hypothetical protein